MSPKLSIIIPSYNDAEELKGLLESISNQSFKDFEVLLIDGGSQDGTSELADSYSTIISQFLSEADRGIFDAMNKGIDLAKGEWLYFIGCDDRLYDPQTLSQLFEKTYSDGIDLLYGKIHNQSQQKEVGEAINNKEELLKKSLWHQAIFYKKRVFDILGKYKIQYKIAADTEMNLRAFSNREIKTEFINQTISKFSGEGISALEYDKEFHKDRLKLYFDLFDDLPKNKLYEALQHHLYIEIREGSLWSALQLYLKIGANCGKWLEIGRHALYYLKLRFSSSS